MNTIEIRCDEVEKVWRGARGSGDMMAGRGALILYAQPTGAEYPHTKVEIVGTAEEFVGLLEKLTSALTAKEW